MTLTYRNTFRSYQKHPRGSPDGATSAAQARVTSSTGEFIVTDENTRKRLYDTTVSAFDSSYIGRLVTIRNTPPSSGTAGTKRMENWTFRIVNYDTVAGDWVELEGVRFEVAGTGVQYVIHASCTFTAASALFPTDESPNAIRTNSGPVVWQAINIRGATNTELNLIGWTITQRNSASSVKISDPYDMLQTFPVESSLKWELRDPPAYTMEDLYKKIHRFMVTCGWTVWQSKGRNNGVGANAFIVHDTIYFSDGEDGKKRMYLRFVAFNNGSDSAGGTSSGSAGFDWAMFSYWDRDYANAAAYNPGNGVNPLSDHGNTTSTTQFAAVEQVTTHTGSGTMWNRNRTSTCMSNSEDWSSTNHATSTKQRFRANNLNTPEGGWLSRKNYVFFGDKDEIQLYVNTGVGNEHIGFGSLEKRIGANPVVFQTTAPLTAGSNVVIPIAAANNINTDVDPTSTSIMPYKIGDRIQIVGNRIAASSIVANTSETGEMVASMVINLFPGLQAATGSITTIAGASHVDGETFTIHDGTTSYTFEFDSNASVGGGNTAVSITGAPSADVMRDRIITAINGTAINITASNGGAGLVTLTHDTTGANGNRVITETVANAGFVVVGMRGGGYTIRVATLNDSYATATGGCLLGEDPQPNFFLKLPREAVDGTTLWDNTTVYRVGNSPNFAHATYRDHNGPTNTAKGFNMSGRITLGNPYLVNSWPNQMSSRFGMFKLQACDNTNDQVRGTSKYFRVAHSRLGVFAHVKDQNNQFYIVLPVGNLGVGVNDYATTNAAAPVMTLGPMPEGMARVD